MKKTILHIISSPRGESSNSIQLSNDIVKKLQVANPDNQLAVRDLTNHPFPHLEEAQLAAFFTPEDSRTAAHKTAIAHSDEAVKELFDADYIVIGVPFYNFSIPSTLKAWIDHIARAGVTFRYSEKGPEGLVKGKKVYLAIATGAIYSEGPYKAFDFAEPYLRAVLGFIGITDIITYRAEGLSIPGIKETAMEKAFGLINIKQGVDELVTA